ncbi:MAG: PPC domain-containing protein [Pirellulaceae bacterium]
MSTPSPTVSPINMSESRPTLINNTIRFSADAAMSADPNSFEETRFSAPRYQLSGNFSPDYSRVGPDIRGNVLLSNSINGLFVKTSTVAGGPLTMLDVAARWDDKDITYVLGENLIIKGTPGGALQENKAPDVSLVQQTGTNGGSLAAGAIVQYRVSAVDLYGAEGVPSAATPAFTLGATASAVQLGGLPKASGDFVSRRLWRSTNGGAFRLVAELDSDTTAYKDIGTTLAGALPAVIPTTVNRARLNARLQIDPGIVVKSIGSRIETGMGAQLIAEGTADRPIIFTSRFDDRYGGGGSFDTNSDGTGSNPGAGNWGGLVTRPFSSMSIDHALIAFGGGVTSVAGGFSGFSAVEVHQADVRLANSRFEVNGSGLGGNVGGNRDGHGPNDASVVFVVGSQPVIINNTFLDNSITNTAVVSINANAMKTTNVTDPGRQTGAVDRGRAGIGNMGPLVDGNHLLGNGLNGMRIRGETLTTETVWDDTDIVHVLQSEVIVPDLHSQGGLRLQSHSDESLVVKLGAGAGLTALGRPLDINDRIGGSLQIIGAPGFPVVMTSIQDDSVGAGFDTNGRALVDTNNNGPSVGSPGDWRSVRFEPYANDRNVDSAIELETDQLQDTGTNDVVGMQSLGALAASLSGGDESLRLGFSLDGSIATPQDLDVYSFSATAGTPVWIDIDRTHGSLDSVVELLDANGRILAQSNNSLAESAVTSKIAMWRLRVPNRWRLKVCRDWTEIHLQPRIPSCPMSRAISIRSIRSTPACVSCCQARWALPTRTMFAFEVAI